MPIIDPVHFSAILDEIEDDDSKYSKHFFLHYLIIASRNLYRNYQTIEASIQFKQDLKLGFQELNKLFGCNFSSENDFDDPMIKDYYRFLYDHIDTKYKNKLFKQQMGIYKVIYDDFKMYIFQPFIDMPSYRSWFFTTSSYVVLTIKDGRRFDENCIKLTNLEIDLLKAAGFAIVLCAKFAIKRKLYRKMLDSISTHKFTEIHFMIDRDEDDDPELTDDFFTSLLNIYEKIDGYFYLYSQFVLEKESKANMAIKSLKKNPRFRYIFCSKSVDYALKSLYSTKTKPFVYNKTGFDDDLLCVSLCNVPLYKTQDYREDFLEANNSGHGIGYILKEDFLIYKTTRIKIIFCDTQNNDHHIERYIDFDSIHFIKSDLYVDETIDLAKTNQKTLDAIDDISDKIRDKVYEHDSFKKEIIFSFFKEKKMEKGLAYVAYAYTKHAEKFIEDFEIHDNQILTAFEACQQCLFEEKRTSRGVIYQVETGEGKTCIVQIIAAVLALMKKTVHITSSNITLSNRDYYNSCDFFDKLGLSSAVLLHYNELPYVNLNNTSNGKSAYSKSKFPRKFFSKKLFKNSSNLNFSVCGINADNEITKDKANIIFSTFVNFESLYLRMMEMCPAYIPKYFGGCSLIIDEADSILIDELTNGTILSRSIKTNANDILKYVYDSRMKNVPAQTVHDHIHKTWPKCMDLNLNDVNFMFQEIDLVNQDEFVDGKKYSIEEFEMHEEKSLIDNLKKSWEDIQQKKEECKNKVVHFFKDKIKRKKSKNKEKGENEKDKDDKKKHKSDKEHKHHHKKSNEEIVEVENITNENDKKQKDKSNSKKVKVIVPFDYDHKGILEPNKEFGGFVQQFIAIKEMYNKEENSNMIIKDVSMNYLYVSHPIFVNLYEGVVGLTGTIGNKYDKKIFREQYNLVTMKIPRNNPNKRVELPILLCEDIIERNRKIVTEVIYYHEKEYPVLVIFQDLNEIASVLYMLIQKGIKNINIFDGKDEKIKPDIIAGLNGAVSLGTNVCGRGTDIKKPVKPLHVIVTYYTSNARVMYQAFGRTARQGEEGSVRIICIKEQYIIPIEILNQNAMDNVLDDFRDKNKLQVDFIEKFKKKREWIFYGKIDSQKLSDDVIEKLRETTINANRIKVCEFEFPICMSIPTFLNIQAQKIFSLFNCPNCKYTWMLFQKYIREMILESWSLFIDNSEKKYNKKKRDITYNQYLQKKVEKLYEWLDLYLPDSEYQSSYGIIETFMYIHGRVLINYQSKVMRIFPENLAKFLKQNGTRRFCSFTVGFKPYSLVDESGAKINTIDGSDQDQHYISDPELKYMKKMPKGRFSILSITEKIDGVFNTICQKINEVIGSYIGLRFFLRRTLGGCEFGVCLDYDLEIPDSLREYDCLIDQDPLLMFTISVKSMAPILAGILIIGLVYLVSISGSIGQWISSFPIMATKKFIKKALVEVATAILSSQIEMVCDKICSFLRKILIDQIDKMAKQDPKIAEIFMILLKIINPKDFSISGDQIQKLFEKKAKINVKSNFGKRFLKENLPWAHFIKIGFLLMLCFASFMMNFHLHRISIKYNESRIAEDYNKKQNTDSALKENMSAVKKDDIGEINDKMDFLELKKQ